MSLERDAFVIAITKAAPYFKEFKDKHVMCVRTILNISTKYANDIRNKYLIELGGSWYYILESISKLDYLHGLLNGIIIEFAKP
jgi:hypothetical protein